MLALNTIERVNHNLARSLEDSLDIGWARLRDDGDDSYYVWMLDVIERQAEGLAA